MSVQEAMNGEYSTSEAWTFEKIMSTKKMANPEPDLGPNQVRYQTRFRDEFTGDSYNISVNYDPDTCQFGVIKESSK